MELSIINIGKSKGIRLSDDILKQYNMNDKIELILEKGYIVLKPSTEPRKGWGKAFESLHKNKEDELLIDDVFGDETFEEWEK